MGAGGGSEVWGRDAGGSRSGRRAGGTRRPPIKPVVLLRKRSPARRSPHGAMVAPYSSLRVSPAEIRAWRWPRRSTRPSLRIWRRRWVCIGPGTGPPKPCHRPSNPPPDHRCINSRKRTIDSAKGCQRSMSEVSRARAAACADSRLSTLRARMDEPLRPCGRGPTPSPWPTATSCWSTVSRPGLYAHRRPADGIARRAPGDRIP